MGKSWEMFCTFANFGAAIPVVAPTDLIQSQDLNPGQSILTFTLSFIRASYEGDPSHVAVRAMSVATHTRFFILFLKTSC